MGRWLAPLLEGPQHWVLHDRDPELLVVASGRAHPAVAADGLTVTVETRRDDLAGLGPGRLGGRVARHRLGPAGHADRRRSWPGFVASCVDAGCPVLVTLSVTGRVRLHPVRPARRRAARPPSTTTSAAPPAVGPCSARTPARTAVARLRRAGVPGPGAAEPVAARRGPRGPGLGVARRLGRGRRRAAADPRHRRRRLPRATPHRPRARPARRHRAARRPAGHPAGAPSDEPARRPGRGRGRATTEPDAVAGQRRSPHRRLRRPADPARRAHGVGRPGRGRLGRRAGLRRRAHHPGGAGGRCGRPARAWDRPTSSPWAGRCSPARPRPSPSSCCPGTP